MLNEALKCLGLFARYTAVPNFSGPPPNNPQSVCSGAGAALSAAAGIPTTVAFGCGVGGPVAGATFGFFHVVGAGIQAWNGGPQTTSMGSNTTAIETTSLTATTRPDQS